MIASVVAILEPDCSPRAVLEDITQIPGAEIGDFTQSPRRIPITIDSHDPNALEETTLKLQQCPGVAFVDVVFVHFEDESPGLVRSVQQESHTG